MDSNGWSCEEYQSQGRCAAGAIVEKSCEVAQLDSCYELGAGLPWGGAISFGVPYPTRPVPAPASNSDPYTWKQCLAKYLAADPTDRSSIGFGLMGSGSTDDAANGATGGCQIIGIQNLKSTSKSVDKENCAWPTSGPAQFDGRIGKPGYVAVYKVSTGADRPQYCTDYSKIAGMRQCSSNGEFYSARTGAGGCARNECNVQRSCADADFDSACACPISTKLGDALNVVRVDKDGNKNWIAIPGKRGNKKSQFDDWKQKDGFSAADACCACGKTLLF